MRIHNGYLEVVLFTLAFQSSPLQTSISESVLRSIIPGPPHPDAAIIPVRTNPE